MRVQVAVVTGVLVACSWGAARADGPVVHLNEIDRYLIKELVVAEVWRPGGAKPDVIAKVLGSFLRSRNYEAAEWLVGEATPFVYRRLLDPGPLAEVASQSPITDSLPGGVEWRDTVRILIDYARIWDLPREERYGLYHRLIAGRVVGGAFGLSYRAACVRGLWEDPREFFAEAEAVCPSALHLRVARARIESSPLDSVLDIVEAAVKAELRPGELVDGVAPDELLDEALLALLMDKQTRAVRRLKEIWRSIPVAARPQGLHAQTRAAFAAQGRVDSEPPRDTWAGRYLVRAIRGLGDPTFQEKNLRFERSLGLGPDTVREELQRKGLYKAEHE